MDVCVFCGQEISYSKNSIVYCRCKNCGEYSIDYAIFINSYFIESKFPGKKYLVSGYLRESSELGLVLEPITLDNYESIFTSSRIPKSIVEKLDKILMYIFRKTEYYGQDIPIDLTQIAIGYAKNQNEFESMLEALTSSGLLKWDGVLERPTFNYRLTVEGMSRAEKLERITVNSNQGFVAMWFDKFMMNTYKNFISKAITDSGYEPFIILSKDYNGDICDHIIAEIRKSKFLMAEFTGLRGGVYFEAGFAYGLGLPVIWCCHEDWFNKSVDNESEVTIDGKRVSAIVKQERHIHFDISHYNFIVWKDGEDLYSKLKNRIQATIPQKNEL